MFHSGVELPEGIVVAMVMGKTNSEAKRDGTCFQFRLVLDGQEIGS
jgi:hypothetical protein